MRKLSIVLATVLVLALTGCTTNQPSKTNSDLLGYKGVSFSPLTYDSVGISDFFSKVKEGAELVTWQGDWQQLDNPTSAAYLILKSADTYGYTPVVVVHAYDNATGKPIRDLTAETRQSYLKSIQKLANDYAPAYLGIGVEINILNEKSPDSFAEFVSLFNDAVDRVKAVSPSTKVFTTLQLERMKGLQGGLFGGQNDPVLAQWSLLDKLSKADLFAFTTYPGIIYNSPADIPTDYYSEISKHTSKPFAISETGWFRESPTGWDASSPQEQSEFVTKLFDLMPTAKPLFVVWSFVYDPNTQSAVFKTMGLLTTGAQSSPAWDTWKLIK